MAKTGRPLFIKDGYMMGVVRNIQATMPRINLKIVVIKTIQSVLFWIADLFELAKDGANRHYGTIETLTQKNDFLRRWLLCLLKIQGS